MAEPENPNSPPTTIDLQILSSALSAFQTSFNDLQVHLNTLKIAVDGLIANNQAQNCSKIGFLPSQEVNFGQELGTLLDGKGVFSSTSDGSRNGIVEMGKITALGGGDGVSVQEVGTLLDAEGVFAPNGIVEMEKITTLGGGDGVLVQELKSHCEMMKSSQELVTHLDDEGVFAPISDGSRNGIVEMEKIASLGGGDGVVVQELRTYCERMDFRGLKRYLVMNLKDIATLRLEVSKALKFAPDAAKLVLECSGRFFLQGRKAYVKGSPMVTRREASVLILECFLLMEGGGNESRVDESVKEEADQAALLWRKRMIGEGGIMKACEIDARGLLLFLGCYGVPQMFRNEDARDLIRAGNVRKMAGTLRRAGALMALVPEIIEGMLKSNLEVDAIDIAYTLGFEEKCNLQKILTALLQKFKVPSKKGKKSSIPSAAVNDTNRKQLAVLRSFVKCLEGHKIDSSKIISGRQVQEKISSLEKDISEYDKKMGEEKTQKRKAEAEAGRRRRFQEGKRSRYTGQGLQHLEAGHNSQRRLADTGMAGHINGYSASESMLHPQVAGTGYPAPGAYGGMVVDPSGHMINHGVQPYGWHGDPTLPERVVSHSYAAQPSSSSMSSLYRPSSSYLEGYVMHPSASSIAVPNQGAATDLYQFADSIVDNEYRPPVMSSDHNSYLY